MRLKLARSWRHTPFRNHTDDIVNNFPSSWRHTPFRNDTDQPDIDDQGSWRHTPFRNSEVEGTPQCLDQIITKLR